jgi:hypothetical protein
MKSSYFQTTYFPSVPLPRGVGGPRALTTLGITFEKAVKIADFMNENLVKVTYTHTGS